MQAKYIAILVIAILAALLPAGVRSALGDLGVQEAALGSQVAKPRQINLAPDGTLLVSIDQSSQIRRITDPVSGAYVAYTASGLVSPIDARVDAAGNIWFADWTQKTLGRIDGSGLTTWALLAAGVPWGVALDDDGRVWVADSGNPYLYRVQPSLNRVCRYDLPDGGTGTHVVYRAGKLWLGDDSNGRILRITAPSNSDPISLEPWAIPANGLKRSSPVGLAAAGDGSLWWADHGLGILARLDAGKSVMTAFTPPVGTSPTMLMLAGGGIWYTADVEGTVGFLNPYVATGADTPLGVPTAMPLTPQCQTRAPTGPVTVTSSPGVLNWAANNWTTLADGRGWTVYQMPASPARANPYGIVALPDYIWVADQGRHLVARFQYTAVDTPTATQTPTSTPTSTATPTREYLFIPLVLKR